MDYEVRRLFLEYGVKNVINSVNTESKALYEELKEIYRSALAAPDVSETVVVVPETVVVVPDTSVVVVPETVVVVPDTSVASEVVDAPPVEKKERRFRIVKKKESVEPAVETAAVAEAVIANKKPGDKVVEVVTLRVKKKVVPPVEVQQTVEDSESDSNATVPVDGETPQYKIKSPEEIKKERLDHRAAVEKKRAELVAQGIVPESLVTKENLEKWLGAGISYQRIAKELTGCHDAYISSIAKSHGLKSLIAGIIAGNYKNRNK